MPKEIERKFLLNDDSWKKDVTQSDAYQQGYIPTQSGGTTVRVRIAAGRGTLTVKGPAAGVSRLEFDLSSMRSTTRTRDSFWPRSSSRARTRPFHVLPGLERKCPTTRATSTRT